MQNNLLGKGLLSSKKLVRLPDKVLEHLKINNENCSGEVIIFILNDEKIIIQRG